MYARLLEVMPKTQKQKVAEIIALLDKGPQPIPAKRVTEAIEDIAGSFRQTTETYFRLLREHYTAQSGFWTKKNRSDKDAATDTGRTDERDESNKTRDSKPKNDAWAGFY